MPRFSWIYPSMPGYPSEASAMNVFINIYELLNLILNLSHLPPNLMLIYNNLFYQYSTLFALLIR